MTQIQEKSIEISMDEIMKQVFLPYDNFIDWAMNRNTNYGQRERRSNET